MLLQGGDTTVINETFNLEKYINYTYLFYITFWD